MKPFHWLEQYDNTPESSVLFLLFLSQKKQKETERLTKGEIKIKIFLQNYLLTVVPYFGFQDDIDFCRFYCLMHTYIYDCKNSVGWEMSSVVFCSSDPRVSALQWVWVPAWGYVGQIPLKNIWHIINAQTSVNVLQKAPPIKSMINFKLILTWEFYSFLLAGKCLCVSTRWQEGWRGGRAASCCSSSFSWTSVMGLVWTFQTSHQTHRNK